VAVRYWFSFSSSLKALLSKVSLIGLSHDPVTGLRNTIKKRSNLFILLDL
jgi:hypothetical protein